MADEAIPNSERRSRGRPKGQKRHFGLSPATPPAEYRIWLAALLQSRRHQMAFIRVLENADHPQFVAATKHAANYAHGLPVASVEVKDVTPAPPLTAIAERVLTALPALLATLAPDAAAKAQTVAAIRGLEAIADVDYEVVEE